MVEEWLANDVLSINIEVSREFFEGLYSFVYNAKNGHGGSIRQGTHACF